MTAVMRAVSPTGPKVLRIGLVVGGRVMENAPEITACEAMIVAVVASITAGINNGSGNDR
jgi:hypothetical protein